MRLLDRLAWLLVSLVLFTLSCSVATPPPRPSPMPTSLQTETPPTSAPAVHEGKIAFASERAGSWQVMAMNADGSDETSLTAPFGTYSRPAWSPDGKRLAMRIEFSPGSGIAVMDVRHADGKLEGSQPVAITQAFADGPQWSPDGTALVYSATKGEGGGWLTFITRLGEGTPSQIAAIPQNAIDPDWSPDGSRLLYAYYADPSKQIRDIYMVNVDGSGLVQLTNTPSINESSPAWSPDGSRIAFVAAEFSETTVAGSDIFIMNSDGSGVQQLTTNPEGDFDPAWSPDGTQLAFVSDRNANNDSNYEIYLVNADGSGEMRLTNNHYTDRWPTWRADLPDDGPIAACQPGMSPMADVTIPQGTRFTGAASFLKVWRVRNSGTCTWTPAAYSLRLTDGEALGAAGTVTIPGAIQPGATVDLAVAAAAPEASGSHTGTWQIFDGAGQPVPGPDGQTGTLSLSIQVIEPGNSLLPRLLYYISEEIGEAQLWRLEADARTRTQITHEAQPVVSFAISSQGKIAYISGNQLIAADRDGGAREVLLSLGEEGWRPGLAWSPDGTKLAYALGGIQIRDLLSGLDRVLTTDSEGGPATRKVYEPYQWSPDGTKLLARVYLWEGAEMNILSASDGAVLARFPLEEAVWAADNGSVAYAAHTAQGFLSSEPGLWQVSAGGGAPQALIPGANTWWPAAAPNNGVRFFMHPPEMSADPDYFVFPFELRDESTQPEILNAPAVILNPNDTFTIRWTKDAGGYVAYIVRPALDAGEVLFYEVDGSPPPLFLMQQIGQFEWGP